MLRVNNTGYEESDLIADAVRRIDLWAPAGVPNWKALQNVFGIPEQAAREICVMCDVNPDLCEGARCLSSKNAKS